jgi:hypothetical protein
MNPKNRNQLLIIVALVAVGLFMGDKILFSPLLKLWENRGKQVKELRAKIADGRSWLQTADSRRRAWQRLEESTLTNDQSQAEQELKRAFSKWGERSGVRLLSMTSPPWKRDNSGDYMTLDCRVEASGNLHAIKNFLLLIEQDSMALKEQTVELSSRDNNGQQIVVGLQVSALVLLNQKTKNNETPRTRNASDTTL